MSARGGGSFNRRDLFRLKVEASATLYLGQNIKKGIKLIDISPRGIGGTVDFPMEMGQKAEILLLYPFFDEPVKKEVIVVWCRRIDSGTWGVGLDFGVGNKLDFTAYFKANYLKPK